MTFENRIIRLENITTTCGRRFKSLDLQLADFLREYDKLHHRLDNIDSKLKELDTVLNDFRLRISAIENMQVKQGCIQ